MTKLLRYKTIGSTNEEAVRLAKSMDPITPTVLIAETQTKGRGRYGHSWYSDQKEGLYYSYLHPECYHDTNQISQQNNAICQGICAVIHHITGLQATIKEPNDILINTKKVCGILSELGPIKALRASYMVIGIGLNINQPLFPTSIKKTATSLFLETGQTYDKNDFIKRITKELTLMFKAHPKGF
ncbi:MAG: biotin--[acetyl-CoA-carboxylase] ligase [Candidatus Margulisbacteria bacterium]|nr:biotin--[acetyl-CoA-carboxylase] ligase [Candidatus Margulisiibacteriota bacterium]